MTKENAAQFLPLVQALADGKTLQYLTYDEKWEDVDCGLVFDSEPEFYRIKPEPEIVKVWIKRFTYGEIYRVSAFDMEDKGWKPATAIITEE